jgi:hypothetical protein
MPALGLVWRCCRIDSGNFTPEGGPDMNSLWQSFRDYFQLLFGFSGRINRAKYWLAVFTFPIAMFAPSAVVWGFADWAIGAGPGLNPIGFA